MKTNRKKTTEFLSNLLIADRFSRMGKYYAREVSVDYGTNNVKRVDFMQFEPVGVTSISSIEKGTFTCYEVKSCIEDVYSGNGLNFLGEKNYIVTTMECYKKLAGDIQTGKFGRHIIECFPESSHHYGILVAVPQYSSDFDEFDNPSDMDFDVRNWKLRAILPCRQGSRKRSINELLFYMLRSGH